MAVSQSTLASALAPTFKSQDYTADNDPEPGLAAELPQRTGTVLEHQTACAANWKKAIDAYLAEMDPPHIVATTGGAGTTLEAALLSAFITWYENEVWDCGPLQQAFVTMGAKIVSDGQELHSDLSVADWEWTVNTAPVGVPDLCTISSIDENSSTPFTSGAAIIAEKIHTWFITGKSTYTKITEPALGSTITYTWEGVVG